MVLFDLVLPKHAGEKQELYYRIGRGSFEPGSGRCSRGSVLTLDTYFNSISCGKYHRWTSVTRITAHLKLTGRFLVEILSLNTAGTHEIIAHGTSNLGEKQRFSLPLDLPAEGLAYLRLTALDEECLFHGGQVSAECRPRSIKLATVICTYRREEQALKNIELFHQKLLHPPGSGPDDGSALFVIDNGQTLQGRIPEDAAIHLVYNKNCGGSGGFTRGLLEVFREYDRFTHVLFMDDDIEFDPTAFNRTIALLRILKDPCMDAFIAGGMLCMDQPTIQHEAGARWDGAGHPLKGGLNLVTIQALLENEREEPPDYAAWWYLCMPLSSLAPDNLPLPFFIKLDDVEYSLRTMRHCLIINGIGVWHESFSSKYNTVLDYYNTRNTLVVNAIHGFGVKRGALLWKLFKDMMRAVAYERPESARYIELGMEHYLTGVDFFLHTDMEQLNQELRSMGARAYSASELNDLQRTRLLLCKMVSPSLWITLARYIRMCACYLLRHRAAEQDYRAHWRKLTSTSAWERQFSGTYGWGK